MRKNWIRSLFGSKPTQPIRNARPRLTPLEDRTVPALVSSVLSEDGTLTFTFNGEDDTAYVVQSGAGNTFLRGTPSGAPISPIFPTASVNAIRVLGGGGNDLIDASGVLAGTPLTLIGEAGNDTLIGNGGANTIYGDSETPDATTALSFVGGEVRTSIDTKFVVTATGGGVVYRQTSQGGVSTRGFGVNNPNDSGVTGTRGIDGDGANGNPTETLIVRFADTDLAAISASLTLGVNKNADNGNDYIIEAFYDNTSVGSVTGGFGANGANFLKTVELDFGGQLFNKVTIRNAQFTTTDAFVLTAASFQTVKESAFGDDTIDGRGGADEVFGGFGNDTFLISNARDAFGDKIHGGFGTDTVKNVTTAETVVLTDFRTTAALGTQTVFGVEVFDGNSTDRAARSEIRGREALFDGAGNEVDLLDFTGITFQGVSTINLRSGDDQYIGGNTALTVNGGSGNDTLFAGIGGGVLNGDAGMDTLTGGTAATTLNGGSGADILNAGVGATTFSFVINDINGTSVNPALNQDTINGFRQGTDTIRINTSIYGQGTLDVISGTGPTASGAASKIVTDTTTDPGNTLIYLPGTSGNAFRRIKLVGTYTLTATDFEQV